jgi:hypothetical protein
MTLVDSRTLLRARYKGQQVAIDRSSLCVSEKLECVYPTGPSYIMCPGIYYYLRGCTINFKTFKSRHFATVKAHGDLYFRLFDGRIYSA